MAPLTVCFCAGYEGCNCGEPREQLPAGLFVQSRFRLPGRPRGAAKEALQAGTVIEEDHCADEWRECGGRRWQRFWASGGVCQWEW